MSMPRWSDRAWAAFGFALMTAYVPGIMGMATTPRWDVGALLALVWFFVPRGTMAVSHWIGLILLGCLSLSLLFIGGDARLDGVNEALQLTIIAVAFVMGGRIDNARPLIAGCITGLAVNSCVVIAEACGWHGVEEAYGVPAGLFFNQDRLAAIAAMVLVAAIVLRWLLVSLPLIAPCLIFTHSAAAWLAVIVCVYVMAKDLRPSTRRMVRIGLVVIACAAIALKLGTISTDARVSLWSDTVRQLSFFGHGLGSFRDLFVQHEIAYDFARFHDRPEHPHNEWLWLAFCGGVLATVIGYAFAGTLYLEGKDEPLVIVLVAFLVLSLVAMPLHDPATAILAACVAGHCVGRRRLVVGVADDGGVLLHKRLASGRDQGERAPLADRA